MRKIDGKVWLTLGVLAALSISGGVIWAASNYHGSFRTLDGYGGIGMNGKTPASDEPQKIVWPENQYIKADEDDQYDPYMYTYLKIRNETSKVGQTVWDGFALLDTMQDGDEDESYDDLARCESGPDGASLQTWYNYPSTELSASVTATFGGDVIITLGN